MKIQYKYFDGRYIQYNSADVTLCAKYKSFDIYKDAEGWYYVAYWDNFQYFGTVHEAKRFIRTIAKANEKS